MILLGSIFTHMSAELPSNNSLNLNVFKISIMVFIHMVVETFGGWEESAVVQLKKLGAALARHTGEEESEKIRHLYERLAILLVKGNAALFLNRLPNHPSPLIDGSE